MWRYARNLRITPISLSTPRTVGPIKVAAISPITSTLRCVHQYSHHYTNRPRPHYYIPSHTLWYHHPSSTAVRNMGNELTRGFSQNTSPHHHHTNVRSSNGHYVEETINGRVRRFTAAHNQLVGEWQSSTNNDTDTHGTAASVPTKRTLSSSARAWIQHRVVDPSRAWLRHLLLPGGFPSSVAPCYLPFSSWQAMETVAASITDVFTTQAMLTSVGLASAEHTTLAVAVQWMLKDGFASLGKLLFTKQFADSFDARPRSWKMLGEVLVASGHTLQLCTLLFPQHFLLLASSGAALKTIAWMIWSCTSTFFTRYLAVRHNIGDVTAKVDSQLVIAELVGMTIGLGVVQMIGSTPAILFGAFALSCPLNAYCTWQGARVSQFNYLSEGRCMNMIHTYSLLPAVIDMDNNNARIGITTANNTAVSAHITNTNDNDTADSSNGIVLPPPPEVYSTERWFGEWWRPTGLPHIAVGRPLLDAIPTHAQLQHCLHVFKDRRYMVNLNTVTNKVHIVLHVDASPADLLQSCLAAVRLSLLSGGDHGHGHVMDHATMISSACEWSERHMSSFTGAAAAAGWDTSAVICLDKGARLRW